MSIRLSFITLLGAAALASAPATSHAQNESRSAQPQPVPAEPTVQQREARPISVDYMNAPLQNVVRGIAAYSGRTIRLSDELGNPAVNISLRDVHWRRALDLILEQQGLVAKDDPNGVIRIDRRESSRNTIRK